MRGRRNLQLTMLAFIDLEERVPTAHPSERSSGWPTRRSRIISSTFDEMYAKDGRPSIPPERCLPNPEPLGGRVRKRRSRHPRRGLPTSRCSGTASPTSRATLSFARRSAWDMRRWPQPPPILTAANSASSCRSDVGSPACSRSRPSPSGRAEYSLSPRTSVAGRGEPLAPKPTE